MAAHERGCESAVLIRIGAGKEAGARDSDFVILACLTTRVRPPTLPGEPLSRQSWSSASAPTSCVLAAARGGRFAAPSSRTAGRHASPVLLVGGFARSTCISSIAAARAADLPSIFTPATRHVSNHRREKDEGGLRRGAAWTFGLVDQRRSMKTHHRRGD